MKRLSIIGIACSVLLACLLAPLALSQKADKPDVKDFMRGKLTHMQKVLEGITIEDYDLIRKEANQLSLLSHATEWRVLVTPEYQQHSAEFRRAVQSVVDAAKKKNLDGAALAYVDTTMKCVTCHKYVRSVRMASVPRLNGDALLAQQAADRPE
jgi:Spy/CpxP family protein refolding chaperone